MNLGIVKRRNKIRRTRNVKKKLDGEKNCWDRTQQMTYKQGGEKGDLGGVETELVEGKLPISLSR